MACVILNRCVDNLALQPLSFDITLKLVPPFKILASEADVPIGVVLASKFPTLASVSLGIVIF